MGTITLDGILIPNTHSGTFDMFCVKYIFVFHMFCLYAIWTADDVRP